MIGQGGGVQWYEKVDNLNEYGHAHTRAHTHGRNILSP